MVKKGFEQEGILSRDSGKKLGWIIALVVIVIALILIIVFYTENCESNEECFNKAAAECDRAKAEIYSEGNLYEYKIGGGNKENCIVQIKLLAMKEGTSQDLKEVFEGRDMVCAIPKEILAKTALKEISNINDYCTGPLKEAYLQLTVDMLYEMIVKNIGPIVVEYKEVLSKAAA